MNNLEALALANKARTDKVLNRYTRDRVTGETYTIRGRIESGAYAFRTRHVEQGKRVTYGLILAREVLWASDPIGAIDYMTPVVPAAKLAFDYAADLPILEFDDDRATVKRVA